MDAPEDEERGRGRIGVEEELDLLDWGMERANGSLAKTELVARKVTVLANINSARIARRFGG